MKISNFNSDDSGMTNITTKNCQIMRAITNRILKLEPMIKISIVRNYAFCRVSTFSKINSSL